MSRKVFIIAFIAILALVCLVACKQEVPNTNSLYGTWTGKLSYSIVTEEYTFTVKDDTNFTLIEKVTMYQSTDTETITGTYKFNSGSDTEGTLTADVESDVIYTKDGVKKTKTIPFTLAGNKLTITNPDEYLSVVLTKQEDK